MQLIQNNHRLNLLLVIVICCQIMAVLFFCCVYLLNEDQPIEHKLSLFVNAFIYIISLIGILTLKRWGIWLLFILCYGGSIQMM